MTINLDSTLQKALKELRAERERISGQIAAIQTVLGADGSRSRRPAAKGSASRGKRAPKSMSAAARKAVSRRMKAYWAKRKAEVTKGKGQGSK
jgi:hypothetical protein